jgi:hypothetical protein
MTAKVIYYNKINKIYQTKNLPNLKNKQIYNGNKIFIKIEINNKILSLNLMNLIIKKIIIVYSPIILTEK